MSADRLGVGSSPIQGTILDAKGDLIVATAADTPAVLTVGSANQVLTVDSSTATGLKWATPAAGGKVLQVVSATYSTAVDVTSTTLTDTGLSASITPSSTSSKILIMTTQQLQVRRGTADMRVGLMALLRGSTKIYSEGTNSDFGMYVDGNTNLQLGIKQNFIYLDSPNTTSSTTYKTQIAVTSTASSAGIKAQPDSNMSSIVLIEIGA